MSSQPTSEDHTTQANAKLATSCYRSGQADWRSLTWGILGCGRVGSCLGLNLAGLGVSRVLINSRSVDKARALCARASVTHCPDPQALVDQADIVLMTVADDAIASYCRSLNWHVGQAVVHCSGATSIDALAHANSQGAWTGGFHPLQVFGDVDQALLTLPGCTIAVEASEPTLHETLSAWAEALQSPVLHLPTGGRALYHAGAGYAAGYIVALLDQACQLWSQLGWSEQQTLGALLPLLRNTVESLGQRGVTASMAGPVSRADVGTIDRHILSLRSSSPDALPLYLDLVDASIPVVARRGVVPTAALQRVRERIQAERDTPSAHS